MKKEKKKKQWNIKNNINSIKNGMPIKEIT